MSTIEVGAGAPASCLSCATALTSANDSQAHVIPNALGGSLKSKGVICQICNTELDEVADNALVKSFGDWPTLLDIPRDRGKNPPKLIETRKGKRVRLERDGKMTRADVEYNVTPINDGHKVQITAGDIRTFRQLLKRAEKQFGQFNTKEAEQHARKVADKDDELKVSLDFSPRAVFGGIVTAIWIFIALRTGHALMDRQRLLEVIQRVQKNGGKFRYLIDGLPGLDGPEVSLGHKIVVRSVPLTGNLIAYVEILGMLKVGGIFAATDGPAELIEHIYAYDVLGRRERSSEFAINAFEFESQNWETVGLGPSDAIKLQEHFIEAMEKVFVNHYHRRFAPSDTKCLD